MLRRRFALLFFLVHHKSLRFAFLAGWTGRSAPRCCPREVCNRQLTGPPSVRRHSSRKPNPESPNFVYGCSTVMFHWAMGPFWCGPSPTEGTLRGTSGRTLSAHFHCLSQHPTATTIAEMVTKRVLIVVEAVSNFHVCAIIDPFFCGVIDVVYIYRPDPVA